jgi:hypothetical protein
MLFRFIHSRSLEADTNSAPYVRFLQLMTVAMSTHFVALS